MSPAFSPDGKQAAYSWDGNRRNFDIYGKSVEGGPPRRLTDNAAHDLHPIWSPDGRRIVFDGEVDTRSAIWLIDADGSNLHRLNSSPVREYLPSWSRDGQWIYCCSLQDPHDRLLKQRPDSGQVVEVTQSDACTAIESSQEQVLYMQSNHGGIWQMPIHGSNPQPTPELADIRPDRYWTLAGDALYFVQQEQRSHGSEVTSCFRNANGNRPKPHHATIHHTSCRYPAATPSP